MSDLRLTLVQTADHWVQEGDTIEVEHEPYTVKAVEPLGSPEFILGYNLQAIPHRVVLTLERVNPLRSEVH